MNSINEARKHYRARGLRGLFDAIRGKFRRDAIQNVHGISKIDDYFLRISKGKLKSIMDSEQSLDNVFDTIYRKYHGHGLYQDIRPQQDEYEHRKFVEHIEKFDPDAILEVGTAQGGTLYPWCRRLDADLIVSVDQDYLGRNLDFYRLFNYHQDSLSLIRSNSQTTETRDQVQNEFGKRGVDFLFIDADHRYDGVRRDFELYSPLVKDGGIIAFHDILCKNEVCGVGELWEELILEYDHEMIINEDRFSESPSNNSDSGGIGLLKVDRTQ